jgi:hypothetical protein
MTAFKVKRKKKIKKMKENSKKKFKIWGVEEYRKSEEKRQRKIKTKVKKGGVKPRKWVYCFYKQITK